MLNPLSQTVNGHEFWMLPVEGGRFSMGSPEGDKEASEDEKPQHEVTVGDFFIGEFPVTQALWRAVANAATEERESIPFKILDPSPSTFQGDMLPVEQISWYDTQVFIQKLNHLTKETRPFGYKYRLPTEAEWEYSARGGKYHGDEYKYSGSDRIKDVGWFIDNSRNETKPPALKGSNQLNIYDMTGNVWEWCEDEWHSNYIGAPIDGSAWIVHNQRDMKRVNRGGRWKSISIRCRISSRSGWPAQARTLNVGFRLALSLQRTKKPDGVH